MSRLIPLITMNILLLSLFAIAQEQENFNQNDPSTWNDNNFDSIDFSVITKQQIDQVDSALLERKLTVEQAKQYVAGRFPFTAPSRNEEIVLKKLYPNVDVASFRNVDRVKFLEGRIETPTGTVDFGNSGAKVVFDSKKGLMVEDYRVSGKTVIHSKDHFTLEPRTLITSPNEVHFFVTGQTEFYTRANSCSGSVSCIESDLQEKILKGIALNGNEILVKANNDFSEYNKIQLFKDYNSQLKIAEGLGVIAPYYKEILVRAGTDQPVSKGPLTPFSADVEVGTIGSKTLLLPKQGGIIREGTQFGKAFASGALNERLRSLPSESTIRILPDTNVIETYRTTDNFDVYKTDKNDIVIIDAQTQTVFYRQKDGVWYGIPKRGEPQKFVPRPGSLTEKTIKEAESGRPSNVVPDKDIPTLNQPGIRTRCPPSPFGIRLRC